MTREMVLRMIKMAEMRDPNETGNHVNRVGAYSIEIYHAWARERGISEDEIKKYKDPLRIAAMLHDIGKIGVSDLILKKGDGLSDQEFAAMKMHTVFGSRLFKDTTSDWEDLASQVALNHHEKWDGSGYPGHIENIHDPNPRPGPGKRGEEIPLAARIVTLADVYDALASQRSYKNPWKEKDILAYLKEKKGRHFDPSLVDTFLSIYDVILAVRDKYNV
jgi:response regulator RpfG family c-di-GMP phosphodiesterase